MGYLSLIASYRRMNVSKYTRDGSDPCETAIVRVTQIVQAA